MKKKYSIIDNVIDDFLWSQKRVSAYFDITTKSKYLYTSDFSLQYLYIQFNACIQFIALQCMYIQFNACIQSNAFILFNACIFKADAV